MCGARSVRPIHVNVRQQRQDSPNRAPHTPRRPHTPLSYEPRATLRLRSSSIVLSFARLPGATVPLASIEGAPADADMVFPPVLVAVVRLPEEVREVTGFDHLGINWEAHGHPPALFMAPQFDFHFYTMWLITQRS